MNKPLLFLIAILLSFSFIPPKKSQFIARQGQVTFFSYTSVENIEAKNNQVLSLFDTNKNELAVSMLMNAFIFKKELMYEHFNDSYIESDIYPKATFIGKVEDFDTLEEGEQTKIIKGTLTIHGISKEVSIKTKITKQNNTINLTGDFIVTVKDFNIKIPPVLASNIAKNISIKFNFNYLPYEE